MPTFHEKVLQAIPAEFHMIASGADSTHAQESYNISAFQLPHATGKQGGTCTTALLKVLYNRSHEFGTMNWLDVLEDTHKLLIKHGLDQMPILSSSRCMKIYEPMYIVPPQSGHRQAIVSK
jgi:hypothetical protein